MRGIVIYLNEVTKKTEKLKKNKFNSPNVYNSNMKVLWLSTPQQRQLLSQGYSFSHLSTDSQAQIWADIFLNTDILEVGSQACFFFEGIKDTSELLKYWPILKKMANVIENWVHSDILSKIYARLLEYDKTRIYPQLVKWNISSNPWKRRQSVVSLFCYQQLRRTQPTRSMVFPLVSTLVDDEHYYVQKGLGWTLREAYQVYPKETLNFIHQNLTNISPIAFTTSMEKVDTRLKEKLKLARKNHRVKSKNKR